MSDPAALPASLRSLKSILARANEIEQIYPNLAYTLRSFALSKSMTLMATIPAEDKGAIMALMDACEKNKAELLATERPGGPLDLSTAVQKTKLQNFAVSSFGKLDKKDRDGVADKRLAMGLAQVAPYFDAMAYFGEPDAQLVSMSRYAKSRANTIIKAIKAGEIPAAPEPNGSEVEADLDGLSAEEAAFLGEAPLAPSVGRVPAPSVGRVPTPSVGRVSAPRAFEPDPFDDLPDIPSAPAAAAPSRGRQPSAPAPAPAAAVVSVVARPSAPSAPSSLPELEGTVHAGEVGKAEMSEAKKHAKYATSALQFNDAPTAIKELRLSLAQLGVAT